MSQEQRIYPPSPIGKAGEVELRYGHVVACTVKNCTTKETISAGAKSSVGGLPDDVVAKKLKQRGWRIRRGGRDRTCPGCAGRGRLGAVLEALGDGRAAPGKPGVAVGVCAMPGCTHTLTLERNGRWPIDRATGMVKAPPSVVKSQLAVAGWVHTSHGELICKDHRAAYRAGTVAISAIFDPEGAFKKHRHQCAPDCPDPRRCFEAFVADSNDLARATYGADLWDETVRIARDEVAATAAAQQAAQAAAEEETMGDVLKLGDAPREPSRDDKRRINAKLTEVCADDGYARDWSDAKVADTLKVPLAWVSAIRSEFFSDHDSNETERAAAKERMRHIHELRRDLTTAQGKLDGALGTVAEAERLFNGLATRLAKLEGN